MYSCTKFSSNFSTSVRLACPIFNHYRTIAYYFKITHSHTPQMYVTSSLRIYINVQMIIKVPIFWGGGGDVTVFVPGTCTCLLCIDGVFVCPHTLVCGSVEVDSLLSGGGRVAEGTKQGLHLLPAGLQESNKHDKKLA